MLKLVKASEEFQTEYLAMIAESIEADGHYHYTNLPLAQSDFPAFIKELEDEAVGIGLPEGIPPQQTYFLIQDDKTVIGEFRYRPKVQLPYETMNGHIGYNLRPACRGKGYGTEALKLMLEMARSDGLAGVQIPIEGDNPASKRIVVKNGGYLEKTVVDEESGESTFCYWVDLAKS
jgi:predicted acetyltransferase